MGALQLEFISSLDNVFKSSNMMVYIVKSLVYASGQCMEQRSCGCSKLWHSAPPGMAVGCCELRLRSTPRYRLVCICFPTPGRGLPGTIHSMN